MLIVEKIGRVVQDFEVIRTKNIFYVDKTEFIREWRESNDAVTLITRPRRFGKTLNMSMTEQFFHWNMRGVQSCLKGFPFGKGKRIYKKIDPNMDDHIATQSLNQLSCYLSRYYRKKVIILLDEYDTPMQEAYVHGYWEELVSFTRSLFNSTFKTNPYIERGLMTGITRVSRESMFSDLNNLNVVTTTSDEYTTAFGFTEREVFAAMDDFGLSAQKEKTKFWYDGFIFGNQPDIYNPWSVINFLDKKKFGAYWTNTSSNSLAGKLIREGIPSERIR